MLAVALSAKARALIQADRDARRPTAADRERVAAALRARLGSSVLPVQAPIRSKGMSSHRKLRTAKVIGLCVVGSVLFLVRRPETGGKSAAPAQTDPRQVALSVPPVSPSSEAGALPQRLPTPLAVAGAAPKFEAPRTAQDSLSEEVALLSRATTQLHSRQPANALATLDQHQRRFPHGLLSQERNAAKAQGLCMLRRFDEGRAALAQLPAGSPVAARMMEACDASTVANPNP